MCSDSEKNMSAFADQNHAPSLTCVRLELSYVVKPPLGKSQRGLVFLPQYSYLSLRIYHRIKCILGDQIRSTFDETKVNHCLNGVCTGLR